MNEKIWIPLVAAGGAVLYFYWRQKEAERNLEKTQLLVQGFQYLQGICCHPTFQLKPTAFGYQFFHPTDVKPILHIYGQNIFNSHGFLFFRRCFMSRSYIKVRGVSILATTGRGSFIERMS